MEAISTIFPRVFLSSLQLNNIEDVLKRLSNRSQQKEVLEKEPDSPQSDFVKEEVELSESDGCNVGETTINESNYIRNNFSSNLNVNTITEAPEVTKVDAYENCNLEYSIEPNPRYIKYFCLKCNVYSENLNRKKTAICKKCSSKLFRQCRKCNFRKYGYRAMLRHLQLNDCSKNVKRFECLKCHRYFSCRYLLDHHEMNCGKQSRFSCQFCSYKTDIRKNIQQHVRRHERSARFKQYNSKFNYFCVKCNTNFDKLKHMHKSCPTCKNKQLLRQCMKCHERFDSYHQTLNHLTNKCFVVRVCPECDQKMDDLDLFERHVQSCGKDSIYNCTTCLFVTDSKDKLRTHMDVHEKQRKKEEIEEKSVYLKLYEHYCEKCKKVDDRDKLNTVCKKCNSKLSSQCIKCKKIYRITESILYHLRTNCFRSTRKRCNRCDKTYGSELILKIHKKYCGKKPKFFCAHCPYKTVMRKNLIRHLQNHHWDPKTQTQFGRIPNQMENPTAKETIDDQSLDQSEETNEDQENSQTEEMQIDSENLPEAENETRYEDDDENGDYNLEPLCILYSSENEATNDGENVENSDGNRDFQSERSTDANEYSLVEDGSGSYKYSRICVRCNTTYDKSYRSLKWCLHCQTEIRYRQCLKCKEVFGNYNHLRLHMATVCYPEKLEKASCSVCNRIYVNLYQLKRHERYCQRKPTHSCKLCSFTTKYKVDLNYHLKDHHRGYTA